MRPNFLTFVSGLALISIPCAHALNLDVADSDSIKKAAEIVAQNLLGYYHGSHHGGTLGIFGAADEDVYWWQSGAALGSLIDYWNYTGDSQYNSLVQQAFLAQTGPSDDFMPPNQTKTEGNDDHGIWGLAAMTAAELQFPNPPTTQNVTWLNLAKRVFELQAARWDMENCGGGLRWQVFAFNKGYDYKNTISTGTFFQLAARLARFTGNSTYTDWAEKTYDWISSSTLITSGFKVYDGISITACDNANRLQWSYNAANFLYGSAVMYNLTNGDSQWRNRTQGFLSAMSIFVPKSNILTEVACQPQHTCSNDQYTFKGMAAQWMGATTQVAPFTANTITPYLQASAQGAAAACSGGDNKAACASDWTGKGDGKTGFGPQLSAFNVILANLVMKSSAPVTAATTSQNASTAGSTLGNSTGFPAPSVSPYIPGNVSPTILPLQMAVPTLFAIVAMAFFIM